MRVNPGPVARVVRAALFAFVCVGAAAVLHGMAAGCQVSWFAIGLGMAPVGAAAYAGSGRERSGVVLTVGLGLAQLGLHELFEQVCPLASASAPAAMPPMPGMGALGMGSGPGSAAGNTIAMLAAHVLAVLVCGWWMGWGEREYFALCRAVILFAAKPMRRFLTAMLVALAAVTPVPSWCPPARPETPAVSDRRPFPGLLSATLTFRGPPVLV